MTQTAPALPASVPRPRYVGARGPRREDDALLRGGGSYVGDLVLPDMAELVIVRSTEPHARLSHVRVDRARSAEGVLAAVVADDLDGVKPFPNFVAYAQTVGHLPLAHERVRYVGAPVVALVAEDRYLGEDAAELVEIDYERLPAVTTFDAALAVDAQRLYDDWPDNRIVEFLAERPTVTTALASGRTVRQRYVVGRHTGMPIECRAYVADYRAGRLTLWSNTQTPHMSRTTLAQLLALSEGDIRIVTPDIGGGFGVKQGTYPEEVLVCWLAMRLGRPVRYLEDRFEHLTSTAHARDEALEIEAAVDEDGTIRALRTHIFQDVGSGESWPAGFCPSFVTAGHMSGPYRIPDADASITCVVSNKTPGGAYRGYGVPEAVFAHERLVEKIAREVGVDSVELRRRMLLRADEFPHKTPEGGVLGSGSYLEAFNRVVELAQRSLERHREALGSDHPRLRIGVGYAAYREGTTPTHFSVSGLWTAYDAAHIGIDADGTVIVSAGVTAQGQGTETFLATVTADALGVDRDSVRVVIGDTDRCPYGLGAWGSRGAVVGAGAILKAAGIVREKMLRIAEHRLEAAFEDLEIDCGRIQVKGNPVHGISLADVATSANIRTFELPPDMDPGLEATATYDPPGLEHWPNEDGTINAAVAWANAAQAAIVSVDIETGFVEILDFMVVHDCGPLVNPTIVDGQVIGGVAQGIGGALYEHLPYSPDGQPEAVTFMDYLCPSATEVPRITVEHMESPSPTLPLGIKGAGEGGTCGPLAVIANAVENALVEYGVEIVQVPIVPAALRDLIARAGPGTNA